MIYRIKNKYIVDYWSIIFIQGLIDCQNGRYLDMKLACNGIDDCGNFIDEYGCGK